MIDSTVAVQAKGAYFIERDRSFQNYRDRC